MEKKELIVLRDEGTDIYVDPSLIIGVNFKTIDHDRDISGLEFFFNNVNAHLLEVKIGERKHANDIVSQLCLQVGGIIIPDDGVVSFVKPNRLVGASQKGRSVTYTVQNDFGMTEPYHFYYSTEMLATAYLNETLSAFGLKKTEILSINLKEDEIKSGRELDLD